MNDELNELEVSPIVKSGKVVKLVIFDEDHEDGVELSDAQYAELGLDKNNLGCVEAHPEGSDRGGYVPTLNDGSYYDENAGEWF